MSKLPVIRNFRNLTSLALLILVLASCGGSDNTNGADPIVSVGLPKNVSIERPAGLSNVPLYLLDSSRTDPLELLPSVSTFNVTTNLDSEILVVLNDLDQLVLLSVVSKDGQKQIINASSTAISLLLIVPSIMEYASEDLDPVVELISSLPETHALASKLDLLLSNTSTVNWVDLFDSSLRIEFSAAVQAVLVSLNNSVARKSNIAYRVGTAGSDLQTESLVQVNVNPTSIVQVNPTYSYKVTNLADRRHIFTKHSVVNGLGREISPGGNEVFNDTRLLSKNLVDAKVYVEVFGPGTGTIKQEAIIPLVKSYFDEVVIPLLNLTLSITSFNSESSAPCLSFATSITNDLAVNDEMIDYMERGEFVKSGLSAIARSFDTVLLSSPDAIKCAAITTLTRKKANVFSELFKKTLLGANIVYNLYGVGSFFSEISSVAAYEKFPLTNLPLDAFVKIDMPDWQPLTNSQLIEPISCPNNTACFIFLSPIGWPEDNGISALANFSISCGLEENEEDCYEADWAFGFLQGKSGPIAGNSVVPYTYPNSVREFDGSENYIGQVEYKDLDHIEGTKHFEVLLQKAGPRIGILKALLGPGFIIKKNSRPFGLLDVPLNGSQKIEFNIKDVRPYASLSSDVLLKVSPISIDNSGGQLACIEGCNPPELISNTSHKVTLEYTPNGTPIEGDIKVTINSNDVMGNESFSFFIAPPPRKWIQEAYVKASNHTVRDSFGLSVSLSNDGNTMAVGAPLEGPLAGNGVRQQGKVYLFTRNGAEWIEQANIENPGLWPQFGAIQKLSGDGITLVVGNFREPCNVIGENKCTITGTTVGVVYVYVRNGNIWTLQDYFRSPNAQRDDAFGGNLDISDDGNTLAVSSRDLSDTLTPNAGAVHVFTRTLNSWSHKAYLKASNADEGDQFGGSISISADGSTLAVGAPREDSDAAGINGDQSDNSVFGQDGAVYVFTRNDDNWSQQAYVKASNPDTSGNGGDTFGNAVSLSDDGNTLAVGALAEDSSATGVRASGDDGDQFDNSGENSGAVYLFSRVGSEWSQEFYIKASNTDLIILPETNQQTRNDNFGSQVSLSSDGDFLAVSAPGEDSNSVGIGNDEFNNQALDSGAVYLFKRTNSQWSQEAYVKASNTGTDDKFGNALSVSGDGSTVVVGAAQEDSNSLGINQSGGNNSANDSGAAYVFRY